MPLPELARRLETRIDVLTALESGDVRNLPPWPETVRIVSAYTLLARIDPRPVLHVIGERISAANTGHSARPGASQPAARLSPPVKGLVTHLISMCSGQRVKPSMMMARVDNLIRLPRGGKSALRWAGAVAVLAVILLLSVVPSTMQQALATGGTGSVLRMIGGLQDYMVIRNAPVRDGFRWIEVEDPRTRKSDKLRSANR